MRAEFSKLLAFLRRDLLVARSYRMSSITGYAGMLAQVALFYIVSQMVDSTKMPTFGNVRSNYLAFVGVGIMIGVFLQLGTGRAASAMRTEQFAGTLEAVLATPTSLVTFQLGSVFYELVLAPIRTIIYLIVFVWLLGVNYHLTGLGTAMAIMAMFAVFALGLGTVSAAAILVLKQTGAVISLGTAILTMASGAYFPLHLIPKPLSTLAGWSPVAVALSSMRTVLIGGAGWQQVKLEVMILGVMASCTLIIGILTLNLALRREQRMGTLGLY